jgi:hypothetical protein
MGGGARTRANIDTGDAAAAAVAAVWVNTLRRDGRRGTHEGEHRHGRRRRRRRGCGTARVRSVHDPVRQNTDHASPVCGLQHGLRLQRRETQ